MDLRREERMLDRAAKNYQRGAIDRKTYENAVDDITHGVPNSYGEAIYNVPGAGEPTHYPARLRDRIFNKIRDWING